jgi:VanZ family protein
MVKKNILSIIVASFILFLSLSESKELENVPFLNIPHVDKIAHFGMYFVFMSVIAFENRKAIKNIKQLILLSLIPFVYGVLMELLQIFFTESRNGDFFDALFNGVGIMLSILIYYKFFALFKKS